MDEAVWRIARARSALQRSCAVLVVATGIACGGSPTAPTFGGPGQLSFDNTVPGQGMYLQEITVHRAGTLTATLSWSNDGTDLDLYLTDAQCQIDQTRLNFSPTCSVMANSAAASGTHEQVTVVVDGNRAYRCWLVNYASVPERFHLEVALR